MVGFVPCRATLGLCVGGTEPHGVVWHAGFVHVVARSSSAACGARPGVDSSHATSNFGVDWGVDEVLDSLVRAGVMPRTLLVTTACTAARSVEYGPGKRGALRRLADDRTRAGRSRSIQRPRGCAEESGWGVDGRPHFIHCCRVPSRLGGRRHLHVAGVCVRRIQLRRLIESTKLGRPWRTPVDRQRHRGAGRTIAAWGGCDGEVGLLDWTSTMWSRCKRAPNILSRTGATGCPKRWGGWSPSGPEIESRQNGQVQLSQGRGTKPVSGEAFSPGSTNKMAISNSRLLSGFAVRAPIETTEFAGKKAGLAKM